MQFFLACLEYLEHPKLHSHPDHGTSETAPDCTAPNGIQTTINRHGRQMNSQGH